MKKILFAILVSILITGCDYVNEQYVIATVKDKAVKIKRDGEGTTSIYLIFTDGGTFKIEDQLFFGKWNSSDIYGEIEVGKTYEFQLFGYRIGILSEYQNILSVKLIK